MSVVPAIDIAYARVEAEAVALIGDAQRTAPFREAGDAGGVAHVAGGVDPCDARVDDEMIDMGGQRADAERSAQPRPDPGHRHAVRCLQVDTAGFKPRDVLGVGEYGFDGLRRGIADDLRDRKSTRLNYNR